MKKFIAMLLLVSVLAVSTAAMANVLFTGSCYVYKHEGYGMTDTIIHKGSILEETYMGKYWTEVELSDGTTGWVRTKYVTYTSKSSNGSPIYGSGGQGRSTQVGSETPDVAGSRIRATGRVNVRSNASLSSNILGTLQPGETVKFLNATRKDSRGVVFYKVSYKGQTAWISSGYSEIVK